MDNISTTHERLNPCKTTLKLKNSNKILDRVKLRFDKENELEKGEDFLLDNHTQFDNHTNFTEHTNYKS